MRQVTITGKEFQTAHDAITELNFYGDKVFSIGRRFFTVTEAEWDRLCLLGLKLCQWFHHDATGRIMSIPA